MIEVNIYIDRRSSKTVSLKKVKINNGKYWPHLNIHKQCEGNRSKPMLVPLGEASVTDIVNTADLLCERASTQLKCTVTTVMLRVCFPPALVPSTQKYGRVQIAT